MLNATRAVEARSYAFISELKQSCITLSFQNPDSLSILNRIYASHDDTNQKIERLHLNT